MSKSKSKPSPGPNPEDPKFREYVIQRLIRDSVPPEQLAQEYGLDTQQVVKWKADFLAKLQTATKAPAKRPPVTNRPSPSNSQPIVQDLSKKRLHSDDRKQPKKNAPFPVQSAVKLSPEDRSQLEKTQRLIIREGKVTVDVGRKLGMLPKEHYEQAAPGVVSNAEAPIPHTPENKPMEEAARERFAANWEKVGGGDGAMAPAPLATPPPPMKLSLHERLVTWLQDLPGISWFLRGGRFDSAPWLLVLLLLAIIGTAFVLMQEHRKSYVTRVDEEATPLYLRPLGFEEIQSAEGLIRQFFRAQSIEELNPLIRAPETLAPVLQKRYVGDKVKPIEIYGFDGARRERIHDKNFTIHGVKFDRLKTPLEVPIEYTSEGSYVDWEIATNYQGMSWRAFRTTKPTVATYFRVRLQPSTYYGKQPFHDPTIFRSFRISNPNEARVMNGYALIDTDLELKLRELLPLDDIAEEGVPQGVDHADVIVGISYPSGTTEIDLVEITEMPSTSWVMDYEAGDVHFDVARATKISLADAAIRRAREEARAAEEEAAMQAAEEEAATTPTEPAKEEP